LSGERGDGAIGQKNSADADAGAGDGRRTIDLFGILAVEAAPDLPAELA
jgi:hypothetical protein